ncbi:MAG: ASCH domain-containing protein [Anaerolineae bacterium]|nr:ASCH domain-containing protein [Anaerolineae bacterium]
MKALSFRQPWAELILQGRKTIDLRTWPTRHRGRLAIHASQQVEVEICRLYNLDPATLVTGALVGTVEVVEMVPLDDEKWESLRDQHLKPGPFPGDLLGWRLHDPQRLPQPVPMSGRLGLFNVPDEWLEQSPVADRRPETEDRRSSPVSRPRSSVLYRTTDSPTVPDKPFELRIIPQNGSAYGLALYQWPVAVNGHQGQTPAQPERLTELVGDPLRAVADHILEALRRSGYKPTDLSATRHKPFYLDEETGLRLALLFLAIKPLTRLDRIEAISSALRTMSSEEAYYWFSKCTASTSAANAQRALRILLAGE